MVKAKGRSGRLVNDPLAQQLPLVSGRWLLWSLTAVFGGGLALVYLTSCLLFWQGQWQILYKPSDAISATPANDGIGFEEIHFAATETGKAQLDGWFIPAPADGRYAGLNVLYLHGMDAGSLSGTVPQVDLLHELGMNVFAFDYRGFGKSEYQRPSEKLTSEDTDAAWQYLVDTRHVVAGSIVLYGTGLGASLAVEAASRHPDAGAVVLDMPAPTALEILRADSRSRWIPLRLLANDRYDPTETFATVKVPILFLLPPPPADRPGRRYAERAADPKMIVALPSRGANEGRLEALRRFLDELPGR